MVDRRVHRGLYPKLETAVVPLYRDAPEKWARLMRTTLAFNGSYFNTNRMVKQYARNAYYPERPAETAKVEEEAFAD
jgi:starch phosphorylase